MAHNIASDDKMAYRLSGGHPWHINETRDRSIAVADDASDLDLFKASGLADWKVIRMPLLIQGKTETRVFDGYKALIRSTDGKTLGVCTDDYTPVQNDQIWEFFSKFCTEGGMKLETAGSLCGGKKVWGCAKIEGQGFVVNGEDVTNMYAMFSTGHEPGYATQADVTSIRAVCDNTVSMIRECVDPTTGDGTPGRFKMSHAAKWSQQHMRAAQGIVKAAVIAAKNMKAKAETMLAAPTTEAVNAAFMAELFMPEYVRKMAEQEKVGQFGTESVLDRIIAAKDASDASHQEIGRRVLDMLVGKAERHQIPFTPTVQRLVRTVKHQKGYAGANMWSTFNAVTYDIDHQRGRSASTALDSALFGQGKQTKLTALDLAIDYTMRMGGKGVEA